MPETTLIELARKEAERLRAAAEAVRTELIEMIFPRVRSSEWKGPRQTTVQDAINRLLVADRVATDAEDALKAARGGDR